MRRIIAGLLVAFAFWGAMSVHGIDLKPEPIRSALRAQIASDSRNDRTQTVGESGDGTASVDDEYRSPWKAGLYSVLLPGGGQLYNDHNTKAKFFLGAEAALWIGLASFEMYANWREDDYVNFAADKANANLEDKSREFHDWVGFYDNIDQYNSAGRVIAPDRPFLEDNAENHWQWQNPEDKATYRHIKNRAREAERRANLMLGLLIVNRFVSAVDAVRDAIRFNRRSPEEFSSETIKPTLTINPLDPVRPIYVGITAPF